jgi:hypothetical protein
MNREIPGSRKHRALSLGILIFLLRPLCPASARPQQKSTGEILLLQDNEFYREATNYAVPCWLGEECSHSVAELWMLMDRVGQEPEKREDVENLLATLYLTSAIARHGSEYDYQKLLDLHDRIPLESKRSTYLWDALSIFWSKSKEPKTPRISYLKNDFKLPLYLTGADDDLKNAWLLYKKVLSNGDENPVRSESPWIRVHKSLNTRNYSAVLANLLSCMNQSSEDFVLRYRPFIDWCGIDWETLLVGAVLDNQANYLRLLGAYGSRQTASYLSMMGSIPILLNGPARELYLRAAATFVSKGSDCRESDHWIASIHSNDIFRQSRDEIPQDLQRKLLNILIAQADAENDLLETDLLSHLLARLCRSEVKDALWKIIRSPYIKPREEAVFGLESLGEHVELPDDPGLTNFRLLVNGVPYADKELEWTLLSNDGKSSTGSYIDTDAEGRFSRDRDYLLNRGGGCKLIFSSFPTAKNISDGLIAYEMNVPKDPYAPVDISIQAYPLVLNFHSGQYEERYKGKMVSIAVSYFGATGKSSENQSLLNKWAVPFQSKIAIPYVMPGKYYIRISMPGAVNWAESSFQMGEKPKELDVWLQPGADLKFELVAPRGPLRNIYRSFKIVSKEGKEFGWLWSVYDDASKRITGLPVGEYQLIVHSSDEIKKSGPGIDYTTIDEEDEFQGAKLPFVIDENSPDVIDLGTINLRP